MSVWKNVGQNLAGLAKHVVKAVVTEPMEVMKDAVGVNLEQNARMQKQTNDPVQQQTGNDISDLAKAGFASQGDFNKYQGLSEKKDDMELAQIRGKLVREWGLDAGIESGMQKARMEYEQKEEQRKKVVEQKEEQKKEFEFQKKQQEDIGLKAAQGEASAENKAWGAG
jgi:hypothetical protein